MAITIKSAPGTEPSAHENLWHVADSTNKAAADFQYVWDIYKGGVLQARLKTRPEGANNYGKLDASLVVRSLLADSVPESLNYESYGAYADFSTDVFFTTYTMAVGEYASGNVSGNIASGSYTAYNYTGKSIASKYEKLLSNRPLKSTSVVGQPLVMTFWNNGSQEFTFDKAEKLNGSTLTTAQAIINTSLPFVVNLSATNTSADSMTLDVDNDLDITQHHIKLICSPRHTPRTLLFLNRCGGWDSYTFALKSQRSIDATRKMHQQNDWRLSGDNMVNTMNTYTQRESRRVYGTEYKVMMELNAYQMTSDEYTWLEELITSPAVYLWESTDNIWQPVMISDTNYRPLDVLIDKGETLKINIEFSAKNITQHR